MIKGFSEIVKTLTCNSWNIGFKDLLVKLAKQGWGIIRILLAKTNRWTLMDGIKSRSTHLDYNFSPQISRRGLNTTFNSNGSQKTKIRLGYLEKLILEYAVKKSPVFTLSEIVTYVRNKGIYTNNKRVYDASQRLVKRHILVKVKRGIYELNKDRYIKDLNREFGSNFHEKSNEKYRLTVNLSVNYSSVLNDSHRGDLRDVRGEVKDRSTTDPKDINESDLKDRHADPNNSSTGDSRGKVKDKLAETPSGEVNNTPSGGEREISTTLIPTTLLERFKKLCSLEKAILAVVIELGEASPRDIKSRINSNRWNIHHALKRLVKRGILVKTGNKYKLSPNALSETTTRKPDQETRRRRASKSVKRIETKRESKPALPAGEQITKHSSTTITTTTPGETPSGEPTGAPVKSDQEITPAYRGVGGLARRTDGFSISKLVLSFSFAVLPHVVLSVFSGCKGVEESKQLVCRDVVGEGRVVTFLFNIKSSGGLVFLEASDNPLDIYDFIGFAEFHLFSIFRKITSREVKLSEFTVKCAPHLNMPGVYLEGIANPITLQDYLDEVVRIYIKGIESGEEKTRAEIKAKSQMNNNLRDIVSSLVSAAKTVSLLVKLERIEKTIHEIKSELNPSVIAERISSEVANLIHTLFMELEHLLVEKFVSAITPEIVKAVREAVSGHLKDIEVIKQLHSELYSKLERLSEKVKRLAHENVKLKKKLREYKIAEMQVKFADLPVEIQVLLKYLEERHYVRIKDDRIEYGSEVWLGLREYKQNFEIWLENELLNFPRQITHVVSATIKAIHYYDNKHRGKPGVPYALWFEKFREYLSPIRYEQALLLIRETFQKKEKQPEQATTVIEDTIKTLRNRLKKL